MENSGTLIQHPFALMAVLMLLPIVFIKIEEITKWKFFEYLPPIIWIFLVPVFLSSFRVIPFECETYTQFKSFAVPMFIILMLLDVNLKATIKIAFRSIGVLVFGALGVVIGSVAAFLIFKSQMSPEAWRGFGALTGSWIGGTGNMAAVAEMVETPPSLLGIVVIADTFIFLLYFPIIFGSKNFARKFNHFTKADRDHVEKMHQMIDQLEEKNNKVVFTDILTLLGIGFLLIFLVRKLSVFLPEIGQILVPKTWEFLILTTASLLLAMTRLRKIPGTKALSLALVYIYMSIMGAQADLAQIMTAPYFLVAALIAIIVHLIFVVIGARIFKTDVSLTAIASCANIGGAASSPVVAAYHNKKLIPVSILLALIGYALGNYLGWITAVLCKIL